MHINDHLSISSLKFKDLDYIFIIMIEVSLELNVTLPQKMKIIQEIDYIRRKLQINKLLLCLLFVYIFYKTLHHTMWIIALITQLLHTRLVLATINVLQQILDILGRLMLIPFHTIWIFKRNT
jgi:hypothetical protein